MGASSYLPAIIAAFTTVDIISDHGLYIGIKFGRQFIDFMVVYELCSLNLRLRVLISGNLPDPWAPKIAIRGFLNRGG